MVTGKPVQWSQNYLPMISDEQMVSSEPLQRKEMFLKLRNKAVLSKLSRNLPKQKWVLSGDNMPHPKVLWPIPHDTEYLFDLKTIEEEEGLNKHQQTNQLIP